MATGAAGAVVWAIAAAATAVVSAAVTQRGLADGSVSTGVTGRCSSPTSPPAFASRGSSRAGLPPRPLGELREILRRRQPRGWEPSRPPPAERPAYARNERSRATHAWIMGGPGSVSARRLRVEIQRLRDMRRSSLRGGGDRDGEHPALAPDT